MAEDFPLKTGSESTLRQTTFCKDMAPHDGYLLKSLYSLLTSFVCNTIMASPTLHEQIVREENSQMPCGDLKIKTTHFVPALLSTCWSDYRIECLYYDNNEEKKTEPKSDQWRQEIGLKRINFQRTLKRSDSEERHLHEQWQPTSHHAV